MSVTQEVCKSLINEEMKERMKIHRIIEYLLRSLYIYILGSVRKCCYFNTEIWGEPFLNIVGSHSLGNAKMNGGN